MTPTITTILLYLVALFLTVATLWPFSYPTQTIFPRLTGPWVLIIVAIPFVMLFYFGLAFLIDDTISDGADHLTAREEELSFTEGLVAAVSYASSLLSNFPLIAALAHLHGERLSVVIVDDKTAQLPGSLSWRVLKALSL